MICSNNKKIGRHFCRIITISQLFAVRILRRSFWTEIGHLAHCAAATVRQCTCYGSSFLCFLEHPMLSSWARRPPVEATLWPKLPNFGQKLWFGFHLRDLAFETPILAMGFVKELFSFDNRPFNLHPLFLFWKHGLWPWKTSGQKYGPEKAGCKKQGHCYSKRQFRVTNQPIF